MEQWKDVVGYEEYYEVSDLGRVRSKERVLPHNINDGLYVKKPRILKTQEKKGYLMVALCINGTRKACQVHRLVAKAFLPNPENKPQVNHIDGDKTNNRLDNLEFVTAKENIEHAVRTGLIKTGSRSHRAILNEDIVREIKIKLKKGDTQISIVHWLEATYGIKVSRGLVGRISNGTLWSQVVI